jgi:hypothetical protein
VRRAVALASFLAASSCAPALRPPPGLETTPSATDAASSLAAAGAAWSRRPDAGAVRDAERLYLQAARADTADVTPLIGAARARAWLAERESDPKRREELAVSCVHAAQWCSERQPGLPACDYWLAIALGLQAREVPTTAEDGIKKMVAALERAIAKDASYDHAGPERVMAIVLARAPGWPLGPGDRESALVHARKAVALDGGHPPNVLALAEALAALDDEAAAREAFLRARGIAASRTDDPDAADWIAQAERGLAAMGR